MVLLKERPPRVTYPKGRDLLSAELKGQNGLGIDGDWNGMLKSPLSTLSRESKRLKDKFRNMLWAYRERMKNGQLPLPGNQSLEEGVHFFAEERGRGVRVSESGSE